MNAELIRYVVTNSDVWWFSCMVSKFTSRLLQRGYPMSVIFSAVSKVSYANRPKYLKPSTYKGIPGECICPGFALRIWCA